MTMQNSCIFCEEWHPLS